MIPYLHLFCVFRILFVQPPVDGHLCCCPLLAVVSNAASWVQMLDFLLSGYFATPSGLCLRVELLDHMGTLHLTF